MSSFDELRELVNGRTGEVIVGTVVSNEGGEVLVRTSNGITRCVQIAGRYLSGSQVRIQGSIILGSVAPSTSVKVHRV